MKQATYSISQVAKFLGVPASTLRYWERQGLFRPDRNSDNSYREYTTNELILAADVSFLRQLGLSVEEVRRFGRSDVEEMDEMLASAQDSVSARIEELKRMEVRLEAQRRACRTAAAWRDRPMEPSRPDFPALLEADYARADHWRLGMDDPRRYGVMVGKDGFLADGFALLPGDEDLAGAAEGMDVLWADDPEKTYWCGLLTVRMDGESSDAERLFEEVRRRGLEPECAVGRLLATVAQGEGERADQYLAWVECA